MAQGHTVKSTCASRRCGDESIPTWLNERIRAQVQPVLTGKASRLTSVLLVYAGPHQLLTILNTTPGEKKQTLRATSKCRD